MATYRGATSDQPVACPIDSTDFYNTTRTQVTILLLPLLVVASMNSFKVVTGIRNNF
jgi:hypothetical protein